MRLSKPGWCPPYLWPMARKRPPDVLRAGPSAENACYAATRPHRNSWWGREGPGSVETREETAAWVPVKKTAKVFGGPTALLGRSDVSGAESFCEPFCGPLTPEPSSPHRDGGR
jgi:hypothetical protein